jgi:hypothetical protein
VLEAAIKTSGRLGQGTGRGKHNQKIMEASHHEIASLAKELPVAGICQIRNVCLVNVEAEDNRFLMLAKWAQVTWRAQMRFSKQLAGFWRNDFLVGIPPSRALALSEQRSRDWLCSEPVL